MGGQILFLIAVSSWAVVEICLQIFRRGRAPREHGEQLSTWVMLAVVAVAGFGARIVTNDFAEGFRRPFTPVRWAGAAPVLASVALRIVSVVQLGRAYSVDLGVAPGQRLVPFVV